MQFIGFVYNEFDEITGAKYLADEGHGYGFNYGYKEIIVSLDEKVSFTHSYTDTSDGTWDNGSYTVSVRLVKEKV